LDLPVSYNLVTPSGLAAAYDDLYNPVTPSGLAAACDDLYNPVTPSGFVIRVYLFPIILSPINFKP
jgi:hypothetical protein